jgi:hypothetical protein
VNIDFGGGGTKDDTANAVAIAANGDIFVVGTATNSGGNTSIGVASLDASGVPVTGFGNNGHEFLGVFGGTNDQGNGIAIQPDGKVVVAGTTDTNGNDFSLTRLDPTTGALDMSFDTTGAKTINFGATSDDEAFSAPFGSIEWIRGELQREASTSGWQDREGRNAGSRFPRPRPRAGR